ncbi:MAG: extracellular solute-binding protein [Limnochordales bacterium]|nr:extracellular solute-binding protein [Limnochordales bacterium]
MSKCGRRQFHARALAVTLAAAVGSLTIFSALAVFRPLVGIAAQKTKLTFMTHYNLSLPFGKVLDNAIKEYEKLHPDIDIEVQFADAHTLLTKILVAQSAGVAPDIVNIAGYMMGDLSHAGILREVPENVRQAMEKAYLPGLSVFATYRGKVYGFPTEFMPRAMVANVRMLEAAGLPARTPTTFAELESWAAKLTQRAADGTLKQAGFGIDTGASAQLVWATIFAFARSNGAQYISPDYRKVLFDSREMAETIEYLAGLVKKGIALAKSWIVVDTRAEKVAMTMAAGPYWKTEFTRPNENIYDRVITGLLPAGSTGKPASPTYGWLLAVTQACQHPDEAWKFITWLTTDVKESTKMTRMGQVMYELGSMPVTRQDLANSPIVKEPFMRGFIAAIQANIIFPDPIGPKALELQQIFQTEVVPAILGTRSVAESLARAAERTQKQLDQIFAGK